jgi:CRP/FNR family transcriptional regulator
MFEFYRTASPDLQREIAFAARPAALRAGEIFVHEGDRCSALALLGSGTLRVYQTGANGRQITLYRVQPGQACLVNLLSILVECPAPATGEAETDIEVLLIPGERLQHWTATHSKLRNYMFECMSTRLLEVMQLVGEVAFARMDQRLAEFLWNAAQRGPNLRMRQLKITHEEIALELGTAREVVSRLLAELQREGVVELSRGAITFRNEQALAAVAGARGHPA